MMLPNYSLEDHFRTFLKLEMFITEYTLGISLFCNDGSHVARCAPIEMLLSLFTSTVAQLCTVLLNLQNTCSHLGQICITQKKLECSDWMKTYKT